MAIEVEIITYIVIVIRQFMSDTSIFDGRWSMILLTIYKYTGFLTGYGPMKLFLKFM